MKVILVTSLLLLAISIKGQNISFALQGKCHEVLEFLETQTKSDSVSVCLFFDNYIILGDTIPSRIKKDNYKELLKYFKKEDNKNIQCCFKKTYYKRTLLLKQ